LTAAYSRRYAHAFSNSTRVFANFGNGDNDDGVAILSENSLANDLRCHVSCFGTILRR
jgi:hypothetical protein